MIKNELSVFKLSWPAKYYFKHPLRFISDVRSNIKAGWRRATKGYSIRDWANFNSWFMYIVPEMLKEMADNGMGYTYLAGEKPEDATPEKWHDWLHSIAERIEYCAKDNDIDNEYAEEFFGENSIDKEIISKYFDRDSELYDNKQKVLKEVFGEIADNWWGLWD